MFDDKLPFNQSVSNGDVTVSGVSPDGSDSEDLSGGVSDKEWTPVPTDENGKPYNIVVKPHRTQCPLWTFKRLSVRVRGAATYSIQIGQFTVVSEVMCSCLPLLVVFCNPLATSDRSVMKYKICIRRKYLTVQRAVPATGYITWSGEAYGMSLQLLFSASRQNQSVFIRNLQVDLGCYGLLFVFFRLLLFSSY